MVFFDGEFSKNIRLGASIVFETQPKWAKQKSLYIEKSKDKRIKNLQYLLSFVIIDELMPALFMLQAI